jgi:hypothetical protein
MLSRLKLLAPEEDQSTCRRGEVVKGTSTVPTLSTFRTTPGLLTAGGPLGVRLEPTFDPLRHLAVPILLIRPALGQIQVARSCLSALAMEW